jgi:uncharacterized protein
MMRLLYALAVIATILGSSAASVAADTGPPPHTITVTANGRVSFEPDVATVQFGVRTDAAAPDAASAALSDTAKNVLAAIHSFGIDDRMVRTYQYQIFGTPAAQGTHASVYYASENVEASRIAVSQVGPLIAAAVQAGANQVMGTYYDSTRHDELQDQALSKALDAAKSEAAKIAARTGVRLGGLYAVTVFGPYGLNGEFGSVPMRVMGPPPQSFGDAAMIPGANTLSVTVQAVYEIKQ